MILMQKYWNTKIYCSSITI